MPRGRPWGVAVTCGAGINCVGVAPDGRTTGFLALGGITGDWGGAYGLGRAALWWAIRAEDGRGPQTALREVVAGHFGMAEVRDVAVAIHLGKISEDDLQGLAPPLMATAAQGDQVARDLVSRLADEIVTMAGTVIRRLGLSGSAVPVVLGGGVLTARDPQLLSWIAERLAGQARGAQVQRGAGAAHRGRGPARPGPVRRRPRRRAPPPRRLRPGRQPRRRHPPPGQPHPPTPAPRLCHAGRARPRRGCSRSSRPVTLAPPPRSCEPMLRSCESHWPLPSTFHAQRAPNRTKHPGKAHVRVKSWCWLREMIEVVRPGAGDGGRGRRWRRPRRR